MKNPEIWEQLTDVFRTVLEDEELALRPETTSDDVEGWDSFAYIELVAAVEAEFGVRFRTGDVANLANVGQMVDLIASLKPKDDYGSGASGSSPTERR